MSDPINTAPPTTAGATGGRRGPVDNGLSEARAVFVKDLRSELRTRAAVATLLLFAVVTLIIVSFTVRTEGFGFTQGYADNAGELLRRDPNAQIIVSMPMGTEARHTLLAALLWIVLFFGAMAGLPRTFVKEEEMRTAAALRLAARPSAVFTGKLLFNGLLVLAMAVVVLPLYLILFRPWVAQWPLFLLHLGVGVLGMAGSATILGAIVARAGGKGYLMLPLAFPLLLPILVLTINGTVAATRGTGGNQIIPLVSYVVAMVTVSALLFEKVWSDA